MEQLKLFQHYYNGYNPKEINGTLIFKCKNSKDANAKLKRAWTYITSLGLLLVAVKSNDNTIIVKHFLN